MPKHKAALTNPEITAFCRQIGMVVHSGLPVYYGLSILSDDAPDEATKEFYHRLYLCTEQGNPLCAALREAGTFPDYMTQMVELGEETGRLEEVMEALAVYYEREEEIRTGIRQAVTYPFILTMLMLAVILVMLTKVLPVFSQVYEELGSELSGSARLLMNISNVLNR